MNRVHYFSAGFSQADYLTRSIVLCDRVLSELEFFAPYGVTEQLVTGLKTVATQYQADALALDEQRKSTVNRREKAANLRLQLELLKSTVLLQLNSDKGEFEFFTQMRLNKLSKYELLTTASTLLVKIREYLPVLTAAGFNTIVLTHAETAKADYQQALQEQTDLKTSRLNGTNTRMNNMRSHFNQLRFICKIGLGIWKPNDLGKYQFYRTVFKSPPKEKSESDVSMSNQNQEVA